MNKKHFIALADKIKANADVFRLIHVEILADFCKSQNPAFDRDRWIEYVAGTCGQNGGAVKPE